VGTYRTAGPVRHGFVWKNGVYTTFNVPNNHPMLGTVAFGINDRGQIVGDYVDTVAPNAGKRRGFLLDNGVYTTFDFPGALLTVAEGINNAGTIVGAYVDAAQSQHGFVLSNGVYTKIDVGVLNSINTAVNSINAIGEIAGSYDDAGGTHGFVGRP
jgi:probable HAF family extracellular repeat protein